MGLPPCSFCRRQLLIYKVLVGMVVAQRCRQAALKEQSVSLRVRTRGVRNAFSRVLFYSVAVLAYRRINPNLVKHYNVVIIWFAEPPDWSQHVSGVPRTPLMRPLYYYDRHTRTECAPLPHA
jgi:hypothetical protein